MFTKMVGRGEDARAAWILQKWLQLSSQDSGTVSREGSAQVSEQGRPRDDDAMQRERVLLPIRQARHKLHIAEVAGSVARKLFQEKR